MGGEKTKKHRSDRTESEERERKEKKARKKELKEKKKREKQEAKEKQYKSKAEVCSADEASSDDESNSKPPPPASPPPSTHPHHPSTCEQRESSSSENPTSPSVRDDPMVSPTSNTPASSPTPIDVRGSQTPNVPSRVASPDNQRVSTPHPRRNLFTEFDAVSRDATTGDAVVAITNGSANGATRVVIPDGVPLIRGLENEADEIEKLRNVQAGQGISQPNWNHIIIFAK